MTTPIVYSPYSSAVFHKTAERHGGCSNMSGGYPLVVNGVAIRTSEALYQAAKFPHLPDVQRDIIDEKSPMAAKFVAKRYAHNIRPGWFQEDRVIIMSWCLQVKLAQNWLKFGAILRETGTLPIVEKSTKDDFWGAKPTPDGNLVGYNVLGQLLTALRDSFFGEGPEHPIEMVRPLDLPDFSLYGEPIRTITVTTG